MNYVFTAFIATAALSALALFSFTSSSLPHVLPRTKLHPNDTSIRKLQLNDEATLASIRKSAVRRQNFCNHYKHLLKEGKAHEAVQIMSLFNTPLTFLDVGANTGSISLPVLLCLRATHTVVSLEPINTNFQTLMRAKEVLTRGSPQANRLWMEKLALSSVNGHKTMYVPGARGDNAALRRKASEIVFKEGVRGEEVSVARGDSFLKKNKLRPNFVKIDVQGAELNVLRGMENFLKSEEHIVILAEHDSRLLDAWGYEKTAVFDYMKKLGFRVYCHPIAKVVLGRFYTSSEEFSREQMLLSHCSDLLYWK